MNHASGFTLVEVMLSIAVITVITGIFVVVFGPIQSRTDIDTAALAVVQGVRRAEVLSRGSDGDMTWGVAVQSGSIILFKGASYASRDTTFDETTSVPSNISFSGLSEIVFAKFSGQPQTPGTITLTGINNDTRTITISQSGMVSY